MLGHEDIATTAKYAHAMLDDMRVAMEAAYRLIRRLLSIRK
jgi:site-specific recombinase XerD